MKFKQKFNKVQLDCFGHIIYTAANRILKVFRLICKWNCQLLICVYSGRTSLKVPIFGGNFKLRSQRAVTQKYRCALAVANHFCTVCLATHHIALLGKINYNTLSL